ncbi:MAG: diguanylate cyclase domain-containing protein, partial [Bradymonadaceae bacterium]
LTAEDSPLLKQVFQKGESVGLTDASDSLKDDPLAIGRTLLALPVTHGDTAVGLLVVGDDRPGALTATDHRFLSIVAKPIGKALHSLDSGTPFTRKTGIDEVTGVFNQSRFFDNAAREFVEARSQDRDLSALMFSIDDWDRISHEQNASATDDILRTVVERASEALRGSDFVGRYAQATFTALLIDVDLEIARRVADRIRTAIADEPIKVGGAKFELTVSVGAAMMTSNVRSADRLVSLADSAMMKAVEQGGDTLELAATPSTPNPDSAQ